MGIPTITSVQGICPNQIQTNFWNNKGQNHKEYLIFFKLLLHIQSYAPSAIGFSDKAACISFWKHVEKKSPNSRVIPSLFLLSIVITQHYSHRSLWIQN